MNNYSKAINRYLDTQSPDYGLPELHSLLEHLWYTYTIHNPIDSPAIRQSFRDLEPLFSALPFQEANDLFDTIADLCTTYEKAAFMEGIHVGVRLSAELNTG